MAYIRTCVHNLGEIRRPVRNNCPSSLIVDTAKRINPSLSTFNLLACYTFTNSLVVINIHLEFGECDKVQLYNTFLLDSTINSPKPTRGRYCNRNTTTVYRVYSVS